MPSPHLAAHCPQSRLQFLQFSPEIRAQTPSPQPAQVWQSPWQLRQSSPMLGSQLPSPQKPQLPQSAGQRLQLSPGSQAPLPQEPWQVPQSAGQAAQVSPAALSHRPSPQEVAQGVPHFWHNWTHAPSQALARQAGSMLPTQASQVQPLQPGVAWATQPASLPQLPQSAGQLLQVSIGVAHLPSPQPAAQGPQSAGQELHVSLLLSQIPLPHAELPQEPPLQTMPLGQIWPVTEAPSALQVTW